MQFKGFLNLLDQAGINIDYV
jgi:hypothetical protein